MPSLGDDLPAGVAVEVDVDGSLRLHLADLDLPLEVPQGHVPGTAVVWREKMYEVVARIGASVTLEPWSDGTVARRVVHLDGPTIERVAEAQRADRERAAKRSTLLSLLPLAALAPGWLQERWIREYNYPAAAGVAITAIVEFIAGTVGMLQGIVVAFNGPWFLPSGLHWLVFVGPVLSIEGIVRLFLSMFLGKPSGSLLSLPTWPFLARHRPRPAWPSRQPLSVRQWDRENGILILACDQRRRDWSVGGALSYREDVWRLEEVREPLPDREQLWVYRFAPATTGQAEQPTLRLVPPKTKDGRSPGVGSTALRTVLYGLAPSEFQNDWAIVAGASAAALTGVAGAIEAFGGLVNVLRGGGAGSPLILLDFLIAGEGLIRVVSAAAFGRPLGSLLGLPLIPLYRRWRRELERQR